MSNASSVVSLFLLVAVALSTPSTAAPASHASVLGYPEWGMFGTDTTPRFFFDASPSTPQMSHVPQWFQQGRMISVGVGSNSVTYVRDDGTLWSIGYNGYGQFGVNASEITNPTLLQAIGVNNAVAVSTSPGRTHNIVLLADETVRTCGANYVGQLGLATAIPGGSTTLFAQPAVTQVSAVAAGDEFSLFLLKDGTVKATGSNSLGQLSIGTQTSVSTPTLCRDFNNTVIANVVAIAAGNSHSLFLQRDGTVMAAGLSKFGAVCNGVNPGSSGPPVTLAVRVLLSQVVSIAAGAGWSGFVVQNGTAWMCGSGSSGLVGTSSSVSYYSPVRATGSYNTDIVKIVGKSNSAAFMRTDGSVLTAGSNVAMLARGPPSANPASQPAPVPNITGVTITAIDGCSSNQGSTGNIVFLYTINPTTTTRTVAPTPDPGPGAASTLRSGTMAGLATLVLAISIASGVSLWSGV